MITSEPLFSRLMLASPFSPRELSALIATAPVRYKEHFIEKRNGRGLRQISQPTSELKFLQRFVVKEEFSQLRIHRAAVAYRPGMSIKDHALPHAVNRYLLKLDFKDFFPSLRSSALKYQLSKEKQYSMLELSILSNILFKRGEQGALVLSIGAPSSPFVSNYLMKEFDENLTTLCKEHSAIYTRYADDLAISTSKPHALDSIFIGVRKIILELDYLNLTLNESKTVNVSTKNRRSLVGLTLTNEGSVSVGRERKRILRAKLHALTLNRLSPDEVARLRGELAFLFSIDPDFVNALCKRHGFKHLKDI